uniref:Uncharacterized protein n=1 Tax=Anguilla anguilla TaxID=7936 RepID=A0A0E9W7S5_ANGAN
MCHHCCKKALSIRHYATVAICYMSAAWNFLESGIRKQPFATFALPVSQGAALAQLHSIRQI